MQLQVVQDKQSKTSMASKTIPLTSYQFRLLAVLALINFVNFADRQVVVPLLPLLRQQMGVTDAQLGSLQTWLLVVLAVCPLPARFLPHPLTRPALLRGGPSKNIAERTSVCGDDHRRHVHYIRECVVAYLGRRFRGEL